MLSDLACIELASVTPDHPLPLLSALGHIEEATALDNVQPVILYNRALVLDRFHLRMGAETAWHTFLETEPQGQWAIEAAGKKARLMVEAEPTPEDFWKAGLEEASLRRMAADHLYPARLAFEEGWLRLWLDAVERGDLGRQAELELAARVVGQVLADRGAHLVADAAQAIDEFKGSTEGGEEIDSLRDFERGMVEYRASRHGEALPILLHAARGLAGWNSGLSYLARVYAAICLYFDDAEAARPAFDALLEDVSFAAERYPSVLARIHWMLTTIDLVQRRLESSLRHASAMHDYLASSSGPRRAAIAYGLMAEALEDRGELERSWTHRMTILEAYRTSQDHRRRQAVLYETAQALSRRGDSRQALVVLQEVLGEARRMQAAYGVAEAHSALARTRWFLGDEHGAAHELEGAREALAAMPADQPLTRRIDAVIRFTGGLIRSGSDPAQALVDLNESFATLEEGGWAVETQLFHRAMADANLALGRLATARNWLEASIQEVDRLRSDSTDAMSRIEIFHHTQETFDRLLAVGLRSVATDPAAVASLFVDAERARKREFGGATADSSALDPFALAAVLPEDTALIAFTVLPDRLLAWVLAEGDVRMKEVHVTRADIREQVRLLSRAAESSSGAEAFPRLAASLYDLLIRPVEQTIESNKRLLLVPDLFLDQLPFAALLDRRSGAYLVEKVVISKLPTARALMDRRLDEPTRESTDLLAVGVARPVNGLPGLPDAGAEAVAVASGYPSSRTLLDVEIADAAEFKRRILQEMRTKGVVHFSGHATVDLRGNEAYLHLADGVTLSTEELVRSDLPRLRLAVLSACRTGRGREWSREGSVSLQNAFLTAGADAVVASLWRVDDELSRQMMTRFHEEFRRLGDVAEALRIVQLESIRRPHSPVRSPAVWATFEVTTKG